MSSFSGGRSGFVAWGFSSLVVCGVTLVLTRYRELQVSRAPTWVAAAVSVWKRAVVLRSRGGAPGCGVRVSWSWYAQKMV